MTKQELRNKIKGLVKQIMIQDKNLSDKYGELIRFPSLKKTIIKLLTSDFNLFLESIDWVAPRPITFRINLLNGQNFILINNPNSWVVQVEGKKYYLSNIDEEEYAAQAISRILQYGSKIKGDNIKDELDDEEEVDISSEEENSPEQ